MPITGSKRVKLNRTLLSKDKNAVVERRRSSFKINVKTVVSTIPDSVCASRRDACDQGPSCSPEVKMSNKPNVRDAVTLNNQERHVYPTCVVQLKPMESKCTSGAPLKRDEDPQAPGSATDTMGKDVLRHCYAPGLRSCSGKKRVRGLIRSVCCWTSCETKNTSSKYDTLANGRQVKPCDCKAKETFKRRAEKVPAKVVEPYPVVQLCNMANICEIPVSPLYAHCILPEELKRKSIHCFRRDCTDKTFLEFYLGSCVNAGLCRPQQLLRSKKHLASLVNKKPKWVPDVKNCPLTIASSVRTCDKHVHYCNGVNAYEDPSVESLGVLNVHGPWTSEVTKVLKESDTTVPVVQSTTVSSSCELGMFSEPCLSTCAEMMKVSSSDMLPTSQDRDHKNGIEESSLSTESSIVLIDTDEGKDPVECHRDTSLKGEKEVDGQNTEPFSCRRTTPYQTGSSCARTYLLWPFNKLKLVDRKTHPNVLVSSTYVKNDRGTINDSPIKVSSVCFCKTTDSVPAEDLASNIKKDDENQICSKVRKGVCGENAESVTLAEKPAKLAPLVDLPCRKPGSPVASRDCSWQLNALNVVVHDKKTDAKEHKNKHFWLMSSVQKERLQHFKIPQKKHNNSADFDKNQSCPPEAANSVTEPCKTQAVGMTTFPSSGLFLPQQSPCVNTTRSSRPVTVSQPEQAGLHCQSEDGNVDSNSDEDLGEYAQLLDSQIMCEIKDACPSPYQEASCLWFNSKVHGASGDVMDLVKAYEQDAIVLDVIEDDPDLFGGVSEVTVVNNNNGSFPCTQKRADLNFPAWRINHSSANRENNGSESSFAESPCLGLPDKKCEDEAGILPGLNEEMKSETLSDDCHPNPVADVYMDCDQKAKEIKTDDCDGGADECFWKDFVIEFSEEQSEMSWENVTQQAESSAEQDAKGLGCAAMDCNENSFGKGLDKAPGLFNSPVNRDAYCKYYFNSQRTCFRKVCWFLHEPQDGDEKFCMDIVSKFSREETQLLLQRAAAVFISYYEKCPPGIYFDMKGLQQLLSALLTRGIIKEMLAVLRVTIRHNILPPPGLIPTVFRHVRELGLRAAVADLLDVTSMCVDAGVAFTMKHFRHMQHCLHLLYAPMQQMSAFLKIKSRGVVRNTWDFVGDQPLSVEDVKRCREHDDWVGLGSMFHNLCQSQSSLATLHHLSRCVVLALLRAQRAAPLPFLEFAREACQRSPTNGLMKNLVGRIAVSLLFRYHGTKQWKKARQLLNVLVGFNINYLALKSLFESESSALQYQTVSVVAEAFLNTGSPEDAFRVLSDNGWTTESTLGPGVEEDVQIRQTLLCRLAECYTQKNTHKVALEVLSHLPGLEHYTDGDVSNYSAIFNVHLNSCIEKNLTVASDIVDFMVSKNIPVDVGLLRTLIQKLAKQKVWFKAKSLYEHAMCVGCYPQALVNQYCRLLPIPHSLTEIEMAIALEVFIASNASEIQGPSPVPLQLVLKRKGSSEMATERDYSAGGSRLLLAAQMATPRLVVTYATVNPSQEQVFTLDPLSACKWLAQNTQSLAGDQTDTKS